MLCKSSQTIQQQPMGFDRKLELSAGGVCRGFQVPVRALQGAKGRISPICGDSKRVRLIKSQVTGRAPLASRDLIYPSPGSLICMDEVPDLPQVDGAEIDPA